MKKFSCMFLCMVSFSMLQGSMSDHEFDSQLNCVLNQYFMDEDMNRYSYEALSELIHEYSMAVSPEKRAQKLSQFMQRKEYHCNQALNLITQLEDIAEKEQERFKRTLFKTAMGTLVNSLHERVSITRTALTYLTVLMEDIWDTLENHATFYSKLNELKYHIDMYNFYTEVVDNFDELCSSGE